MPSTLAKYLRVAFSDWPHIGAASWTVIGSSSDNPSAFNGTGFAVRLVWRSRIQAHFSSRLYLRGLTDVNTLTADF